MHPGPQQNNNNSISYTMAATHMLLQIYTNSRKVVEWEGNLGILK